MEKNHKLEQEEQKLMLYDLLTLFINILNLTDVRNHFSRSSNFQEFINELMTFIFDPEPTSIQLFIDNVTVRNNITQVNIFNDFSRFWDIFGFFRHYCAILRRWAFIDISEFFYFLTIFYSF